MALYALVTFIIVVLKADAQFTASANIKINNIRDGEHLKTILESLVLRHKCQQCSLLDISDNSRLEQVVQVINTCISLTGNKKHQFQSGSIPLVDTLRYPFIPLASIFPGRRDLLWLQRLNTEKRSTALKLKSDIGNSPETSSNAVDDEIVQASRADLHLGMLLNCAMSRLGVISADGKFSMFDLYRLIDGLVSQEKTRNHLVTLTDRCYQASLTTMHTPTLAATTARSSQLGVFGQCMLDRMQTQCQLQHDLVFNPLTAMSSQLHRANCVLRELPIDTKSMSKVVACMGEAFESVSSSMMAHATQQKFEPGIKSSSDQSPHTQRCVRSMNGLDLLLSTAGVKQKSTSSSPVAFEQKLLGSMSQCVLLKFGLMDVKISRPKLQSLQRAVAMSSATILVKKTVRDSLKTCSLDKLRIDGAQKASFSPVGFIGCVLERLAKICPAAKQNGRLAADPEQKQNSQPPFLQRVLMFLSGGDLSVDRTVDVWEKPESAEDTTILQNQLQLTHATPQQHHDVIWTSNNLEDVHHQQEVSADESNIELADISLPKDSNNLDPENSPSSAASGIQTPFEQAVNQLITSQGLYAFGTPFTFRSPLLASNSVNMRSQQSTDSSLSGIDQGTDSIGDLARNAREESKDDNAQQS